MEKASKKGVKGFIPGRVTNPAGRPRGSKDKVTTTVRKQLEKLLEDNMPGIKDDLKAVTPNERLRFYAQLFQYFVPKLSAIKAEISTRNETGAETLSTAELTQFILEIESDAAKIEGNAAKTTTKENDNPTPI